MKKNLLTLISAFTVVYSVNAQTILNDSFENWTDVKQETVDGTGMNQFCTKVTDKTEGQFAIKLENNLKNSKVDAGVVVFGKANNGISGGIPYNASPDSIVGYAKYDIKNGDAAIIWVKVWAGGNSSGVDNMFYLMGNSSNNFVRLAYKLDLGSGAVDSIAIGLTSGNFAMTPIVGSWIIWDDVKFVGNNATQLPNTNFENWTNTTLYSNPADWMTNNNEKETYVKKSTDAHSGTYALETTANIQMGNQNYYDKGAVNNYDHSKGGGFLFHNNVDTLVFFYKLSGTDSASVIVNMKKGSNYVGHS